MMLICGLLFAAVSIPTSYAQPDYTYRLHKIVTWTFETHGKPTSPAIPKCLDVLGGNATQASVVGWWDCDKGDEMEHSNQMWHMDKQTGNVHFQNTSLCLDIGGANYSFDAPLQLWQCLTPYGKPAHQQQWFYSACDSGGEDGPACDHPAIAYGSWASVYAKAPNGSYWKVGGMPFEVDPGTANGRLATIWPGSMQTDANVAAIPALSCFDMPGYFHCSKVIDGISITVQNQQQEIINGSVSVKPDHVPSRTVI